MLEKLMLAIAVTICMKLLLAVGIPTSSEPAPSGFQLVETPTAIQNLKSANP